MGQGCANNKGKLGCNCLGFGYVGSWVSISLQQLKMKVEKLI